jgi:hypothetical protein
MSWFASAYVLSLTVLTVFAVWIAVDCSFRWIPYIVGQDLRLRFLTDPSLRQMHTWQIHGPRLALFGLLILLGTISTGAVVIIPFGGTDSGRSGGHTLLAVGFIAVALAVLAAWKSIWWWAFRVRIRQYLDAMKAAIDILSKQWPSDRIVLRGLGSYEVSGHDPNLLYIEGKCPDGLTDFAEAFDRISRNTEGEFSFAVRSYPGCWVHRLAEGHVPRSFCRDVFGTAVAFDLQTTGPLDRGWWLACYVISLKDTSSDVSSVTAAAGT